VSQSRRVTKPKTQRSAAVGRVPRRITVAAVKHFTGMRVDADAIGCVEEM